MKCDEGNKLDLVEYLFSLGFTPTKIRDNNYWYISPFRNEKEASFKVNKAKNVWYDHVTGKGGDVVDFIRSYFNCDVATTLQKLSFQNLLSKRQFNRVQVPGSTISSETSQPELINEHAASKMQSERANDKTNQYEERPPFHLHENSLINHRDAAETAIEIIAAKQPITDMVLCRYLKQRMIDKTIADTYCHEVIFKFSNKDAKHIAVGFRNSAGGYELRSDYFKLSSSPKYITYLTNNKQNYDTKTDVASDDFNASDVLKKEFQIEAENFSNQPLIVSQNVEAKSSFKCDSKNKIEDQNQTTTQLKSVTVFEGFFDLLSYQTVHQNQQQPLTDFLVLNSLAFFERSLLIMEKHKEIYLYLDNDEAGKKCLDIALKRSQRYKDESSLYESYKDLNDWLMNFGKHQQKQSLKVSNKNRLLKFFLM